MDEARKESLVRAVGQVIAARRAEAGMSQEGVAERLGITREAVSRIETGVAVPTVVRLAEFAEIFGCGIEEFLTKASNREVDQARRIVEILNGLTDRDREMLLDVIQKISGALPRKQGKP